MQGTGQNSFTYTGSCLEDSELENTYSDIEGKKQQNFRMEF